MKPEEIIALMRTFCATESNETCRLWMCDLFEVEGNTYATDCSTIISCDGILTGFAPLPRNNLDYFRELWAPVSAIFEDKNGWQDMPALPPIQTKEVYQKIKCPECGGRGGEDCVLCHGNGEICDWTKPKIAVELPTPVCLTKDWFFDLRRLAHIAQLPKCQINCREPRPGITITRDGSFRHVCLPIRWELGRGLVMPIVRSERCAALTPLIAQKEASHA